MAVVITLEEQKLPKVDVDQGGAKRSFHVHHDTLIRFMQESVEVIEKNKPTSPAPAVITLASPTLPLNTVKYAQSSNGQDVLFMIFPESVQDVKYHQHDFLQVPYPNLVFGFKAGADPKRLLKCFVAAYKDRFLREDTPLFRFPFSNVYPNGKMCYYNKDTLVDLVQLQTFPHTWVQSPNNDHLYYIGETNQLNQPLRQVFE